MELDHEYTPEELERCADSIMEELRSVPSMDDDPEAQLLMLWMSITFATVAATYKAVAKQLRRLQGPQKTTKAGDPNAN